MTDSERHEEALDIIEENGREIERLRRSIRIIRTWAATDSHSISSRETAMLAIRDKCDQALQGSVK